MKASARLVVALLLLLTSCTPAVSSPVPTEIPSLSKYSVTPTLLPDEPPPARASSEFKIDFNKHSVPYSEIFSGSPPKDGIPALKDPQFVSVAFKRTVNGQVLDFGTTGRLRYSNLIMYDLCWLLRSSV